jgi:serine/threonine-protein kinase
MLEHPISSLLDIRRSGGEMFEAFDSTSGRINGYEVQRRLGANATSDVLLAVSHGPYGFKRPVVIKRLRRSAMAEGDGPREFAREAMAFARLAHPCIVRLYDFFETEEELCIVLEYVDGVSVGRLRSLLRAGRQPLPDSAVLYVAHGLFGALDAAHGARDPESGEFAPIIHRDVSPDNVLLGWDGSVKLTDFGFAKVSGVASNTRTGLLKGTYGYMAPEQVTGEAITVRTDVYAACVILREMLLGRATFDRDSLPELELLQAMASPQLAPIEHLRENVPPELATALHHGLARDPDERTITSAEMLSVIRGCIDLPRAHDDLVHAMGRVRAVEMWDLHEQRATTRPSGMPRLRDRNNATTDPGPIMRPPLSSQSGSLRALELDLATTPDAPPLMPAADDTFGILSAPPEPSLLASRPRGVYDTPDGIERDATAPPSVIAPYSLAGVAARRLSFTTFSIAACLVFAAVAAWQAMHLRGGTSASAAASEPPDAPMLAEPPVAAGPAAPPSEPQATDAPGAANATGAASAPNEENATGAATAAGAANATGAASAANEENAPRAAAETAPARAAKAADFATIVTPASAAGHRVFVDDRVAGVAGDALRVRCGTRRVRIGSSGKEQRVLAKCGETVTLER